jgi:predicted nucleic acid-binding protein
VQKFASIPMLTPERQDHVSAAEARNLCRRKGVQIGTTDALLIQMCVRHQLVLLSADRDFEHASRHIRFQRWQPTR